VITGKDGNYTVKWNAPGKYFIHLQTVSQAGCASLPFTDSVTIREHPLAEITHVSNNNVCIDDTMSVTARDIYSYKYNWSPADVFSHADAFQSTVQLKKSTLLVLTVTDTVGCKASDSAYITARPCCELYLPNAFTPNNDGRNDVFRTITEGNNELVSFIIVNRFGEKVFIARNINSGWDGIYNGEPQDAGTYFYYLKYKCTDGSFHEKKGDVILVR
jgi:gliding motility-associated-like protein